MEPVSLGIDQTTSQSGEEQPALLLRPPGEADLPQLGDMFADPQAVRWTLVADPWDEQQRDRYLERVVSSWRDGSPRWLISDAAGERVLGIVGLIRDGSRRAELIYQVAPWARRQGVALRACRTALDFGFRFMKLRRISWDAIVGNHLSRLLAMRLGFQFEGTARAAIEQRGVPVDVWTASLLPHELRDPADPPPGYPLAKQRAELLHAGQPTLPTEQAELRLRPLRDDDIDDIHQACQDAQMLRWTTISHPYPREMAEGFVRDYAAAGWRQGTLPVFALADAADRYCGTIDLRLPAIGSDVAEVGFNTAPWARGKGYMTAALRAICDFGFDRFGCVRIEWKAFVGNEASRRVAEKAGFRFEGTLRQDLVHAGRRRDSWLAAMVKEDR
jgi:RimJ/RimL family protein N-acetyltransferase